MSRVSRAVAAAAVIAFGITASGGLLAAARADALPFVDPNVQGFIGFCDKDGHPVTSGKLTDVPFVWTAIASTPTPPGYAGKFGKATLGIFVPRQGVDPGDWAGKQFTASTTYTNPKHPIAQATYGDPSLVTLTGVAPPNWEGLVQVRMYFSNADVPPLTTPYPATVIKVTGDTWRVVSGGTVACSSGKGTSLETVTLPPSKLPSSAPSVSVGPTAASPTAGGSGLGSSSAAQPGADVSAGPTSSQGSAVAAGANGNQTTSPSSTSSTSAAGTVAIALAALVLGGFGVYGVLWWRGRGTSARTNA